MICNEDDDEVMNNLLNPADQNAFKRKIEEIAENILEPASKEFDAACLEEYKKGKLSWDDFKKGVDKYEQD